MLNFHTKLGTHVKVPELISFDDFLKWSKRFEAHLDVVDANCLIPFLKGYDAPWVVTLRFRKDAPKKPTSRLTFEQKIEHDGNSKTIMTMALLDNIFHQLHKYTTSHVLYESKPYKNRKLLEWKRNWHSDLELSFNFC